MNARTARLLLATVAPALGVATLIVGLRLGTTARAPSLRGVVLQAEPGAKNAVVLLATTDLEDGAELPRGAQTVRIDRVHGAQASVATDRLGYAAITLPVENDRLHLVAFLPSAKEPIVDEILEVPHPGAAIAKPTILHPSRAGAEDLEVTPLEGPLVIGQASLVRVRPRPGARVDLPSLVDASRGLVMGARVECTGYALFAMTATFPSATFELTEREGKVVYSAEIPVAAGALAFESGHLEDALQIRALPNDENLWVAETSRGGFVELRSLSLGRAVTEVHGERTVSTEGSDVVRVPISVTEGPLRTFYAQRSVSTLLGTSSPHFSSWGRTVGQRSGEHLCAWSARLPETDFGLTSQIRVQPFSARPAQEALRQQIRRRGLLLGTVALLLTALVEVAVFLSAAAAERANQQRLHEALEAGDRLRVSKEPSRLASVGNVLPGIGVVLLGSLFVIALLWH